MINLRKLKWGKKGYRLVNIIGGAAYLVAFFGYIVLTSLLFMATIPALNTVRLIPAGESNGGSGASVVNEPSILTDIVTYGVAAIVLIVSLFAMVMLPYWIGKTGNKVVTKLLKALRIKPNLINSYIVKVCLSVLPFLLMTIAVIVIDVRYAFELLVAVAISSFVAALIFTVQSTMAVVKNRHVELIW